MSILNLNLRGACRAGEVCELDFLLKEVKDNGYVINIASRYLNCSFSISTFFYGYNITTFVDELGRLGRSRRESAVLINYDQGVEVTVASRASSIFIRMTFDSVHPLADDELENGTKFSIGFFKLGSTHEIESAFRILLEEAPVENRSPYPGSG